MRENFQNSERPKAEMTELSNEELRNKKLADIELRMSLQIDNARRDAREGVERPLKYMEERLRLSLTAEQLRSFEGFLRVSKKVLTTLFTSQA